MVLVIGSDIISPNDIRSLDFFFEKFPDLSKYADTFAATKPKIISPTGVAYVRQKDYLVTYDGDTFEDGTIVVTVGTEDLLTCHAVILSHPFTKVIALGHFDEFVKESTLNAFLSDFLAKVRIRYFCRDEEFDESDENVDWEWESVDEGEEEADCDEELDFDEPIFLHLIGGYSDEGGKAERLSRRILNFFIEKGHGDDYDLDNSDVFRLVTCCIGPRNTQGGRYFVHKEPIVGGVAVGVSRHFPCPASFNRKFLDSSLDEDLRMSLMLGPSLIRRPAALKKLVAAKEDSGYSSKASSRTLI